MEDNNLFEMNRQYEEAASNHNAFPSSEEYTFVRQFAKRYGGQAGDDEYNKLQQLLKSRGRNLTIPELWFFVERENNFRFSENVKSRILNNNPQNREEILKSYLHLFQSNDIEMLKVLAEILIERNLPFEGVENLKTEVETIQRGIEIENFERLLAKENEQIWIEDIDRLNGYEFEDFLKNLFIKMGYQVEQTRLSGDQGADLVVVKFGEKTVIQAKRYSQKVGNYAVQEIMAAISLYKAQKGMVITNNYFTPAAVELANANNIELVDRDALEELINKHW